MAVKSNLFSLFFWQCIFLSFSLSFPVHVLSCVVCVWEMAPILDLCLFYISIVPSPHNGIPSLRPTPPSFPAYSNALRLTPRHVRRLPRVDLDLLSDLDEHGHGHSGAGIELGRLGATLGGVALEVGVGLHHLVDVVGRQLHVDGPIVPLGYLPWDVDVGGWDGGVGMGERTEWLTRLESQVEGKENELTCIDFSFSSL